VQVDQIVKKKQKEEEEGPRDTIDGVVRARSGWMQKVPRNNNCTNHLHLHSCPSGDDGDIHDSEEIVRALSNLFAVHTEATRDR
jgi:hypothetical protein